MDKVEGIILKEIKYGETSKILNIYTKELGKISIIVKGAYNPKSKLIANTQTFSLNEFQLRKGKNFYYITDADLVESFYSIREDIDRIVYGYYMLELIDKSVPMEQQNEKLYEVLKKGLKVLDGLNEKFLEFIIGYELKFISFLGYRPVLDRCVNCGEKHLSKVKFSIDNGGLLCDKCFSVDRYSRSINKEIYDIINSALFSPLEKLSELQVEKESLKYIHELLVDYILFNIDRKKFNSLIFLEKLM